MLFLQHFLSVNDDEAAGVVADGTPGKVVDGMSTMIGITVHILNCGGCFAELRKFCLLDFQQSQSCCIYNQENTYCEH